MFKMSYRCIQGKKAMPPGGNAFANQMISSFLESHLVTISAKLFSILTIGFRGSYASVIDI